MTIAQQLAAEAKELTLHELPPEVVHRAKRSVLRSRKQVYKRLKEQEAN